MKIPDIIEEDILSLDDTDDAKSEKCYADNPVSDMAWESDKEHCNSDEAIHRNSNQEARTQFRYYPKLNQGLEQNPVVHQKLKIGENTKSKREDYSSVNSLSTEYVSISFTDNVKHYMNTNSSDLRICEDDSILQCWNIDSKMLDSTDKGIFLVGCIDNTPVPMMIDTGASCSVMSRKVYEMIPIENRPKLVFKNCGIKSVSGEITKCDGVITYKVDVGDFKLPIQFHVVDIHEKVILGMSFLSQFGAVLDTKNGTIEIQGKKIPCIVLNGRPKPRRVYIKGEHIIPPGREVIIPGISKDRRDEIRSNTTISMLFEPKTSFLNEYGLMVCASTIMNSAKTVPIRVFNPSENPIILKGGMEGIRVGFLKPTEVVNTVFSKADIVAQVGIDLSKAFDGKMPEHLCKMYQDSCTELTADEQEKVKHLLLSYEDIFSQGEDDVGRTNITEHVIKTKNEVPIKQRPRPLPLKQSEEVERQVQLLLKSGMISISESAWSSPIVCVRKKDGSLRMCVDYRKLNDVTIKDAHPIPPINQSIDALSGSKYFCSLDLVSGYNQVPVHPDSKAKTAFCTRSGLYEYNVMSFGLCNAPATFQRMMEKILNGLHWQVCMVYLDDILVYGKTFQETLERLELVFIRLRAANLKLKPKKCSLFSKSVLYLGYVIGRNGVHTDPAKIKAVKDFEKPKDVQGVRKFLGLTNYYRKFVKDYAKIAYPLNRLLDKKGKGVPFIWNIDCDKAFDTLKQKLVSAPILSLPKEEGMYILDTDASAEGMGGVLQQMQDGELRVISYNSKSLSKTERNYCVSRQELLAIVYHIMLWKCYLWGNHFIVRTDHSSLRYLISFKNPSGQLARWIDALSEYDFEIQARPGKKNGNADVMSRIPCGGKKCFCEYSCSDPTLEEFDENPCPLRYTRSVEYDTLNCTQSVESDDFSSCDELNVDNICTFNSTEASDEQTNDFVNEINQKQSDFIFPWTKESMKNAQRADSVISTVIYWVEQGSKPEWKDVSHLGKEVKSYLASWKNLTIEDGVLYRKCIENDSNESKHQLVIPVVYKQKLLFHYHDVKTGGHLGFSKMYSKIQAKYFWSEMKEDIILYVKTCLACQKKKSPPKSYCAPLQKYVVGVGFERIALDIMGPLIESNEGYTHILVVSDYFTRWVEAYPLKTEKSEEIANILAREWIPRFGCPSELHSDNGKNLTSDVMQHLCQMFDIDKTTTVIRRPSSDGIVERYNATVQNMLATAFSSDTETVYEWPKVLPFLMMAYRNSRHESLGFSPTEMVFGKKIALPLEAFTPKTPNDKEFNAPEFVQQIRRNLRKSHEIAMINLQKAFDYEQKSYLNRLKPNQYKLKDSVMYWQPTFKRGECPKLLSFWQGPFYVVEILSDVVYRIQKDAKCKSRIVHHNQIKPYFSREEVNNIWLDHIVSKYAKKSDENTRKPAFPAIDSKDITDKKSEKDSKKNLKTNESQSLRRPMRIKRISKRYNANDWLL